MKSQFNAKFSHIKVYRSLVQARKAEAIKNGGLDVQVLEDSVLVYTRYATLGLLPLQIKRPALHSTFLITLLLLLSSLFL